MQHEQVQHAVQHAICIHSLVVMHKTLSTHNLPVQQRCSFNPILPSFLIASHVCRCCAALLTICLHPAGSAAHSAPLNSCPHIRSSIFQILSFLNTLHVCGFCTTLHTPFLQALLPVPPFEQLPSHLQQLWGSTNSFSMRFWPTLCGVRALSNCSLVVLDANKFAELLEEYDWVSVAHRQHACVPSKPQRQQCHFTFSGLYVKSISHGF
jgi:hypothetical protein